MRNLIIVVVVIVVLSLGAYFLLRGGSEQNKNTSPTVTTSPSTSSAQPSSGQEGNSEQNSKGTEILFDGNGFSPSSVTIKSGRQITWVNNSSEKVQIGANPHPIHTGNKEVSGGEFVLEIGPGERKSTVVTKTGTFGYHNHLRSSQGGSITVE